MKKLTNRKDFSLQFDARYDTLNQQNMFLKFVNFRRKYEAYEKNSCPFGRRVSVFCGSW
jgi:hypothetical protein